MYLVLEEEFETYILFNIHINAIRKLLLQIPSTQMRLRKLSKVTQ